MEINKDNQNKKKLGRGLGSLLGGGADFVEDKQVPAQRPVATAATAAANLTNSVSPLASANSAANLAETKSAQEADIQNKIWNIAIDKLVPGVYQPRKNFDKEALAQLAESIKQNGILQPIAVRKRKEGGYEIIAGERRWRAAQIAGLHEVPALIKTIGDREALQLAIIENIQREDLDPIEEAESYQRLIEEFNLSQQEAAEKVGKERSSVANALRLLSMPKELKEMVSKKTLSVGHAKVLMGLTNSAEQIRLAQRIQEKPISVRALENEIKGLNKSAQVLGSVNSASAGAEGIVKSDIAGKLAAELADQLQKTLGTKVQINYKQGKGSLEIHFYSDDQLNSIYEKLKQ